MKQAPFHLAFPALDLAATKTFFVDGLGAEAGRETPTALILNLYGNQIVAHRIAEPLEPQRGIYPRHFGLVFSTEEDWRELLNRAKSHGLKFYQEEKIRHPEKFTEHRTFFLEDPTGNLLEFKFYRHPEAVFGFVPDAEVGE
jgi:uncharacterized protein